MIELAFIIIVWANGETLNVNLNAFPLEERLFFTTTECEQAADRVVKQAVTSHRRSLRYAFSGCGKFRTKEIAA